MELSSKELSLSHPFSCLVAGSRGVGKTTFVKNLIKNQKELIDPNPDRIVWCYVKHQPELLKQLMEIDPKIEYVQGIPSDIESMFDRKLNNLIVIDDMMNEATKDKNISHLFTRGRHDNVSVIYLTQNLFHKYQREISLNSDYVVVFKSPRAGSQFTTLAKQLMIGSFDFLRWAYTDATKLPRDYLFLDLKPESNDKLRVRAKVLPHEKPLVVYMPN